MCLFHRHTGLVKGSLVKSASEEKDITTVKSYFNDNIWNFIAPEKSFNPENFQDIIHASEKLIAENINHSIYVNKEREAALLGSLKENKFNDLFTDHYIMATDLKHFEVEHEEGINFIETDDSMREKHLVAAAATFPEYEGERAYTERFLNFGKEHEGKQFRNFILEKDGEIITFGSVIYDVEENLAYLHNAGTVEEFRRQGHFERFRKSTLNYLIEQGVTEAYAIVEDGGASESVLAKLGFESNMKFQIYSK